MSGTVIALGAAHTSSLLPDSIRGGAPAALGGVFYGLGLDLHSAGLIAAMVVMFASYVGVVAASRWLSLRSIVVAIVALYALVLLAPPLVSTDIFSYQAYARMGLTYSINPYTHGPYAISPDAVFPYIGYKWSYIPSVYGPLFTVFSYALAPLSIAASVIAYKSIAVLAAAALVVIVWRCAHLRGSDPVRAVALVGLNPLLVVYGIGGGHNDLIMMLAMVGGVYAFLATRERLAGGLGMLAVGLKLTAGIVLPFALLAGGPPRVRRRRDLVFGAALGAAAVLAVGFGAFGSGLLEMFSTLNRAQSEGVDSIPGLLASLGIPGIAHVLSYVMAGGFAVICGWLLRRVWRGNLDWVDAAGWATLAMLVASSSLLPWYVAWLLPLAALGRDERLVRSALVITGLVQLIQLINYIPHVSTVL